MLNDKYVIGISVIGGGVAQSVVNSCRLAHIPLYTIGFGTNAYAFGMYDCDEFQMTTTIYNDKYVPELIEKCLTSKVDLLIPGLDDELVIFSDHIDEFQNSGIKVLLPGKELISVCRDKKKMYEYFSQFNDFVVKTFKPQELTNKKSLSELKFPLIAKPIGGRGSKGIVILHTEEELSTLDPNYIIQELVIPHKKDLNYEEYIKSISKKINPQISEVSIQVVADINGVLLGRMASYNKLSSGVPIEILPVDDPLFWDVIDQLMPHINALGFRGPLNIQGRITEDGFKIFEMNARFTGITGLRAIMGFNEVEECIKSWLGLPTNGLEINKRKFGIRKALDKTVEMTRNQDVLDDFLYINTQSVKPKHQLLITEPLSLLGRHLIKSIDSEKYQINLLSDEKGLVKELYPSNLLKVYDFSDLYDGSLSLGNIDKLIHLGYYDDTHDKQKIANWLRKSNDLINTSLLHQLSTLINISTYMVYNLDTKNEITELEQVSPQTYDAQAMYAIELMVGNLTKVHKHMKSTSIRMATLCGGEETDNHIDELSKTIQNYIKQNFISEQAHDTCHQFIDVDDAIDAILRLIDSKPTSWKPVYNLGEGRCYSPAELNYLIAEIGLEFEFSMKEDFSKQFPNSNLSTGMSSRQFELDFNWKPERNIKEIIRSVFNRL